MEVKVHEAEPILTGCGACWIDNVVAFQILQPEGVVLTFGVCLRQVVCRHHATDTAKT